MVIMLQASINYIWKQHLCIILFLACLRSSCWFEPWHM